MDKVTLEVVGEKVYLTTEHKVITLTLAEAEDLYHLIGHILRDMHLSRVEDAG